MEKIHLDFIGPLTRTKRGNMYILCIVDAFTRWVEAIALPDQTAETTALAAVREFFSRFGYPLSLLTDQGRAFESVLFTEMCKLLQIRKLRTTPYRPSTNGMVERMNAVVIAALRHYVSSDQTDWDEFLPLITSAIRASKCRSTGFSANMLMLGRELVMPSELELAMDERQPVTVNEHVTQLKEELLRAHEFARTSLMAGLKREKRDYDLHQRVEQFTRGDAVYLLDKGPAKRGKSKKLSAVWSGPHLVTATPTPYTILIKRNRNKASAVSHDMLKKCHDDDLPAWLRKEQEAIANARNVQYCICRKPDDGLTMIQCGSCGEWFLCDAWDWIVDRQRVSQFSSALDASKDGTSFLSSGCRDWEGIFSGGRVGGLNGPHPLLMLNGRHPISVLTFVEVAITNRRSRLLGGPMRRGISALSPPRSRREDIPRPLVEHST